MCEAAVVIALAWPEESEGAAVWPTGLPQGYEIRYMLPCLMRWIALAVLSGTGSTIKLVLQSSLGLPDFTAHTVYGLFFFFFWAV